MASLLTALSLMAHPPGVTSNHQVMQLRQLPPNLQLSSLVVTNMDVQLQPAAGFPGVVRPGVPLKQLQLCRCLLFDGVQGLAAALSLLSGLQHLSISIRPWCFDLSALAHHGAFSTDALLGLQQLTYIELAELKLQGPGQGVPALQPLQGLTCLADLRLCLKEPAAVESSMLAGARQLTRLQLSGPVKLGPGALAALTQLQHLQLARQSITYGAVGAVQLLSELQLLQQLTHLGLSCCVMVEGSNPPAAAFTALTASSKLQHLDIRCCRLPTDVWQRIFPAGRQLLQLRGLHIANVSKPGPGKTTAPEGSRLVSCCPGLQLLDMDSEYLLYNAEVLAPLQGLSELHTLRLGSQKRNWEGLQLGAQLRELYLFAPSGPEGLWLQLIGLTQLTSLTFWGATSARWLMLTSEVS
jgi:hypothetical protein